MIVKYLFASLENTIFVCRCAGNRQWFDTILSPMGIPTLKSNVGELLLVCFWKVKEKICVFLVTWLFLILVLPTPKFLEQLFFLYIYFVFNRKYVLSLNFEFIIISKQPPYTYFIGKFKQCASIVTGSRNLSLRLIINYKSKLSLCRLW